MYWEKEVDVAIAKGLLNKKVRAKALELLKTDREAYDAFLAKNPGVPNGEIEPSTEESK